MAEEKKYENPPEVRSRGEYQEGVNAYALGCTEDESGYEQGTAARMSWLCGWYDARTNDRLGHIFKRHGMVHP